jgi:hypothetical protein
MIIMATKTNMMMTWKILQIMEMSMVNQIIFMSKRKPKRIRKSAQNKTQISLRIILKSHYELQMILLAYV